MTSKDSYTCAASIVSQRLGIRKGLQLGENIFEFTPTEIGPIRFSCTMGMYTGSFEVVDGSGPVAATTKSNVAVNTVPNQTAGGAASCSANGGGCGCGGGKKTAPTQNTNQPTGKTITQGKTQLLKATYTSLQDIVPNTFIVKANQPVRFEIDAKDDGQGCMGSVTIPKLTKKVEVFTKGQKTVFEFTPTAVGTYAITCAMGIPRGQIQVN